STVAEYQRGVPLMDVTAQRRYGALSAAQVAALDEAAMDIGVDILQLMEVAGFQVARLAWRMLGSRPRRVHVVAGHGNNGGDALVAARQLCAWGCAVTVAVHVDPSHLAGVVDRQARAAEQAGVAVVVSVEPDATVAPAGAALVIDGLLGTGLSGAARPNHAAVVERMRGTILSIDVPSGLSADAGVAAGTAVQATATCTLTACKRGFWIGASRRWTGALYVADIGMPRQAWVRCGLVAPTLVRGGTLRRVPEPAAGG
ncbi:MAG: NAD(P)H-hydrate epimerase, partial [Candidatus Dormibacteraeota bacterium]|nr:NAD(P)H-hydrate epimerase [Candidatus Dormibacteraeota bacterium]